MPIPRTRTRENRRGYPPRALHLGLSLCVMARPRTIDPEHGTRDLFVRISERDHAHLQRVAKKQGKTVSALVREQVQELLAS